MRKKDELSDPNSCLSRAADDEWTFVLLGRDPAADTKPRRRCWPSTWSVGKNT